MKNSKKPWAAIITAVLGLAVVIAAVITFMPTKSSTSSEADSTPRASVYTPPVDNRIKLEIYGDSITQGDTPYDKTTTGEWSTGSWPLYLGKAFGYAGGYARGGTTSGNILKEGLQASINGRADYLIIELGTNDLMAKDRNHDEFWSNVTQIVEKQKYTPEKVVIVLVGPEQSDELAPIHKEWNELTVPKAKEAGYHVIDPWAAKLATPERKWSDPTYHFDSKHPSREGAKVLGEEISRQLLAIEAAKK